MSGAAAAPAPRELEALADLDAAARSEFLRAHPELRSPHTVAQLIEASRAQLRVDFQRALSLADAALEIASALADASASKVADLAPTVSRVADFAPIVSKVADFAPIIAIARSLRAKGNALCVAGQNREALVAQEQALAGFQSARERAHSQTKVDANSAPTLHPDAARALDADAALTLNAMVQPLLLLGDYDRALRTAQEAKAMFAHLGDERRCARVDINIGNLLHRQDRFEEAVAYYEGALDALLRLGDAEAVAGALSNMAVCLISLNDFPRALAAYSRARELCQQNDMPLLTRQADYNIAYLYYLRGEYSRAIQMLAAVQRTCTAAGDPYHSALCNLDLSEIHVELNLSDDAAEMAQAAVAQFEQLGMGYEAAKAQTYLAVAMHQQGKNFRALELLAGSGQRFLKEQNRPWAAMVELYRAMVLGQEGRIYEAHRLCENALAQFESSKLGDKATLCRLLLARLFLRDGNITAARQNCELARAHIANAGPGLRYQTLCMQAAVESAAGNRSAAYQAYLEARSALEALRGGLRAEELKIAFIADKLHIYERLVELCLEGHGRSADGATPDPPGPHGAPYSGSPSDLQSGTAAGAQLRARRPPGSPERARSGVGPPGAGGGAAPSKRGEPLAQAFAFVEEAKSRSLSELIFEQMHARPSDAGGQSDLVRRMRELRDELNWYYHRIEQEQLQPDASDRTRLEALQTSVREREKAFSRLVRELPKSEADVFIPAVLPLEKIRAALQPGVLLLEYFRIADHLIALRATCDSVDVVPLTLSGSINEQLQMLVFQFSKFRLGPDYVERFGPALLDATRGHLHTLYRELLAPCDLAGAEHIVFVPHEHLHSLPFHALLGDDGYVIETRSVSYVPSATVYALCQRPREYSAGGAGAPSNSAGAPGARINAAHTQSLVMGVADERAPSIEREARELAALLGDARLLLGSDATAEALRQYADSRIIHIASHGVFRRDSPRFSGIRLADAYLTMYDLHQLSLSADLVSLSGCSTGVNAVAGGDELIGLTRGLLCAGARTLLLSLWDVEDESAAAFMRGFYQQLQNGTTAADAVRTAMLAIAREHPHPYYWAPFCLIGKDNLSL